MADLMKFVKDEFVTKDFPRAGDTITVYYEIKEGEKLEHSFQRSCYQRRGSGNTETFTIRKCQVL
jgi:large subunit ribosomal protein L19